MNQAEYRRRNRRIASLIVSPRSAARSWAASHSSSSTRTARAGLLLRGRFAISGNLREAAPNSQAASLGRRGRRVLKVTTVLPDALVVAQSHRRAPGSAVDAATGSLVGDRFDNKLGVRLREHGSNLPGVNTPVNTPGGDCWDACLLACHHDNYDAMCDEHYAELIGDAA